jgi:hypothetical protein
MTYPKIEKTIDFEVNPGTLQYAPKQNRYLQRSMYSIIFCQTAPNPVFSSASNSDIATASPLPLTQTSDITRESTNTGDNGASRTSPVNSLEEVVTADQLSPHDGIGIGDSSEDVWSAAYREAVESLGEEIRNTLSGKNAEQLFKEVEGIGNEKTHESAFLRGVQRLRFLKVPLDTLKLALDLASPLANLEPTASTVFGVVRSVTAVSLAH